MTGTIILYTLIAGVGGTGLGGIVGSLFKKDSSRTMSLLLSFAAGIMLSVVCFDLVLSSIEHSNVIFASISIVFGVTGIYILNLFVDKITIKRGDILESHPKTADHLDELIHSNSLINQIKKPDNSTRQLLNAGILMVLAIALHNFPEGLSIGSSFSNEQETGFLLAVIIALHNIPEGMAIVTPLICGGMKKSKAILLTALSGSPTIIGAVIGYLIGGTSDLGLAICLGLASGAMVYVVFGEIIPQSFLMYKSKIPTFFIVLGMIIGLVLIYLI